jgi:saccharopine dehydrogenase (NADP+, L-glutamate forming)/spermidine synthase
MQALDKEARDKGLCFLNECGVDPGLDHMSAMRVIHAIPKGAKLRKFTSICGGLPAPSNNDNPFGYKLSWSPRGVLLASNNSALIFRDGEQVQVEGLKLFSKEHTTKEFIEGVGELEWYYNRNSVMYADIYGIPETETLIRGTYRFEGWCSTLSALKVLGFTALSEDAAYKALENAAAVEYSRHVLKIAASEDPKAVIASRLNAPLSDPILERFEWIGMFDSELKVPKVKTALDFMCWLFQRKLVYKNGEKDMIVMRHTFEVRFDLSDFG